MFAAEFFVWFVGHYETQCSAFYYFVMCNPSAVEGFAVECGTLDINIFRRIVHCFNHKIAAAIIMVVEVDCYLINTGDVII